MFLGIIQQTVTDSSSAVIHKNSVKFLELDPGVLEWQLSVI